MAPPPSPELSVIIPTHNRRDLLHRCLEALGQQTQDPSTFEVVVVDDGSSDGTADMAERLSTPFVLRVLRLDKCGKPTAGNAGIDVAGGAICLFLDDDVIASPTLVAEHLAAHEINVSIIGIGALTQQPAAASDWYAHAFARSWNEHYEQLAHERPNWSDCYGANMSVRRSALIEVGKFSDDFATAEDTELAFRLWSHGCVPTFLPRAHGVHDDQKRRGRMLHDARRIGADSIRLIERHPATLPARLGGFREPRRRDVALRRILLALRCPPGLLAMIGRLIPGKDRRQLWFYFVDCYAFWLGVRENMTDDQWVQTTRGIPSRSSTI